MSIKDRALIMNKKYISFGLAVLAGSVAFACSVRAVEYNFLPYEPETTPPGSSEPYEWSEGIWWEWSDTLWKWDKSANVPSQGDKVYIGTTIDFASAVISKAIAEVAYVNLYAGSTLRVSGPEGGLNVLGLGSPGTYARFLVGGQLQVENGSQVKIGFSGSIGQLEIGTAGSISVSGSTSSLKSGFAQISGTTTIDRGGLMSLDNTSSTIKSFVAGGAALNIRGEGSKIVSASTMHVRNGTLSITDKAQAEFTGGSSESSSLIISSYNGSATEGLGQMNILGGGRVSSNGYAWVGDAATDSPGDGKVVVSGTGSTWEHSHVLRVSDTGSIEVNDGGTLDVATEVVARGDVTIDGGTLRAGYWRHFNGTLTLVNGARVTIDGNLSNSTNPALGGSGTIQIDGDITTVSIGGEFGLNAGSASVVGGARLNAVNMNIARPLTIAGAGTTVTLSQEALGGEALPVLLVAGNSDTIGQNDYHLLVTDGALLKSNQVTSELTSSAVTNYSTGASIGGLGSIVPTRARITNGATWEHDGRLYVRGLSSLEVTDHGTLNATGGIYVATETFFDGDIATYDSDNRLLIDKTSKVKTGWLVIGSGVAEVRIKGTLEAGSLARVRSAPLDTGAEALCKREIHFDGAVFKVLSGDEGGIRLRSSATSGSFEDTNDILAGSTYDTTALRWARNGFLEGELIIDSDGLTVDTNGQDVTLSAPLGGRGGLVKTGQGALRLTNGSVDWPSHIERLQHTFTGGITVEEGILGLSDATMDPATVITLLEGSTLELNFVDTLMIAALFINGQQIADGVWGAGDFGDYLTGIGKLQVGAIPEPSACAFLAGLILLTCGVVRCLSAFCRARSASE